MRFWCTTPFSKKQGAFLFQNGQLLCVSSMVRAYWLYILKSTVLSSLHFVTCPERFAAFLSSKYSEEYFILYITTQVILLLKTANAATFVLASTHFREVIDLPLKEAVRQVLCAPFLSIYLLYHMVLPSKKCIIENLQRFCAWNLKIWGYGLRFNFLTLFFATGFELQYVFLNM